MFDFFSWLFILCLPNWNASILGIWSLLELFTSVISQPKMVLVTRYSLRKHAAGLYPWTDLPVLIKILIMWWSGRCEFTCTFEMFCFEDIKPSGKFCLVNVQTEADRHTQQNQFPLLISFLTGDEASNTTVLERSYMLLKFEKGCLCSVFEPGALHLVTFRCSCNWWSPE